MNFSNEIVQEFQVAQVNFDLGTGIAVSGAINVVTRSGGNDFHGSGYFFYRDHNMAAYPGLARSRLDPNPFFARRNPGMYIGGPIKKDKAFFFFNYEYTNQVQAIQVQPDLPSIAVLEERVQQSCIPEESHGAFRLPAERQAHIVPALFARRQQRLRTAERRLSRAFLLDQPGELGRSGRIRGNQRAQAYAGQRFQIRRILLEPRSTLCLRKRV